MPPTTSREDIRRRLRNRVDEARAVLFTGKLPMCEPDQVGYLREAGMRGVSG